MTTPGRWRWAPLAALATLALVLLGGCGDGDRARVRFAAVGWPEAQVPLDRVRIEWDAGRGARSIDGAALRATEGGGRPHSAWFETPTAGTIRATVLILGADGAVAGRAEIELALRADWEREIQLVWATEDPGRTCFGCEGTRAIAFPPVPGAPGGPWLAWGGNSIRDPVVY